MNVKVGLSLYLLLVLTACSKSDLSEQVAFYALRDFETDGPYRIEENSAKIGNEILIPYSDLQWYNSTKHSFAISESLSRQIDIGLNSTGYFKKPFAVAIGKEIIYTGYFWSALSSTGCDWTTAIPLGPELLIQLSYPGPIDGVLVPDRRNDHRILEIFRRDGKLVE